MNQTLAMKNNLTIQFKTYFNVYNSLSLNNSPVQDGSPLYDDNKFHLFNNYILTTYRLVGLIS